MELSDNVVSCAVSLMVYSLLSASSFAVLMEISFQWKMGKYFEVSPPIRARGGGGHKGGSRPRFDAHSTRIKRTAQASEETAFLFPRCPRNRRLYNDLSNV